MALPRGGKTTNDYALARAKAEFTLLLKAPAVYVAPLVEAAVMPLVDWAKIVW